jgi:hypothetical protein
MDAEGQKRSEGRTKSIGCSEGQLLRKFPIRPERIRLPRREWCSIKLLRQLAGSDMSKELHIVDNRVPLLVERPGAPAQIIRVVP